MSSFVLGHPVIRAAAALAAFVLFLPLVAHAQTNEFRGLWVDAFNTGFKKKEMLN